MLPAMHQELIALVSKEPQSPDVASRIRSAFSNEKLRDGSAVTQHQGEFLWALEADSAPTLYVDDEPVLKMTQLGDSNLYIHTAKLLTGWAHAHHYRVGGEVLGGKRFDTASLGPDSSEQDGVPQGKMSEHMIHESRIYPGYKVSWWVYASPGVDPDTPLATICVTGDDPSVCEGVCCETDGDCAAGTQCAKSDNEAVGRCLTL